VTHDQAEALAISDQIAVMHGGVLIEVGSPHQLYSRPTRRFTATFLGLTNLIDGKIVELTGDAQPGKIQTKKGLLSFIPAPGLKKDQAAVVSIRPENIPLHKVKRYSWATLINVKLPSATIFSLCIPIRSTP
jgi:ABC-type Fe3+/spermidine/putrescine transport system ATPase subunit